MLTAEAVNQTTNPEGFTAECKIQIKLQLDKSDNTTLKTKQHQKKHLVVVAATLNTTFTLRSLLGNPITFDSDWLESTSAHTPPAHAGFPLSLVGFYCLVVVTLHTYFAYCVLYYVFHDDPNKGHKPKRVCLTIALVCSKFYSQGHILFVCTRNLYFESTFKNKTFETG